MARRCAPLLLSVTLFGVLTACGTDTATKEPSGDDSAGEEACSRFRDLAADAFAEQLTESQVVSGLQEVGSLSADSTTPAIRDNGVKVGTETNASAMINGDPNPAQDALAEACNSTFPLNP